MLFTEFEKLLDWFENKDQDAWFVEKRKSKIGRLKTLQSTFCPCELHNMYDVLNRQMTNTNIKRALACMKRSNMISQYKLRGTTFVTDDELETKTYFPPVHVDDCDCLCTNSELLKKHEQLDIIQSYRKFMQEM